MQAGFKLAVHEAIEELVIAQDWDKEGKERSRETDAPS